MSYPYHSKFLEKLNIRSMVNAQNWSTTIGGTDLDPEVAHVMAEVGRCFLNLRELIDKTGKRVAELCQVDAACITTGAAAGITLSLAAAIAGKDQTKWAKLPFTDDPPINGRNQVIIQGNQSAYEEQYACAGGRLIKVGGPGGTTPTQLEDAITEKTAAIAAGYHYNSTPRGLLPYDTVAKIGRKHDLPSFCDCAGAFPPYSNLHKITDWGFDIAIFSGGKGIRGPQDTGLILAKGTRGTEMVEEIKKHSSPNNGFGRGYKVSKEALAGLVTALELVLSKDEEIEYQKLLSKARYMASHLEGIPGVHPSVIPNDGKTYEHPQMARIPNVRIDIDKEALGLTSIRSVYEAMEKGEPGVYIRFPRFEDREYGPFTDKASVFLFTYFLREGEEKIAAERMRQVLTTRPWMK